ncbi:MAG: hypothetical protein KKE79_04330 [Actinobacteria bacterium]|nr:hypothetical protein [Actinomycetota bacterium]MBU4489843.1 hypothetical protein [Actinomycetota bacterium]MCG2795349.1 hypothetical protein [Actinomycetes bacterium]
MKTTRILVMCALAAILFATAAGCTGPVSKNVPATTPSLAMSESSPSAISPSVCYDSYIRNIQAGRRPIPSIPAVSASEAKTKTGISVRLPKNTKLTGKLMGIYPYISASESPQLGANPQLGLHFTNCIIIDEEACKEKPDFEAEAAGPTFNGKPADEIIGSEATLVKVAGFQGMLRPEWTSGGATPYKLPPQLQWWENGVRYFMSAWKLGYSGQQLLDIANSMY